MSKAQNQHVFMTGSHWTVKAEGDRGASRTFDSRREAILYAQEEASKEGAIMKLHTLDGRIREIPGELIPTDILKPA